MWNAILSILGKVSNHVQGRIERLKNEKNKLLKEMNDLHDLPCNAKNVDRKAKILCRIMEIDSILINNSNDN